MTNPNSEYQTIISKIDLLNEKLELYKKTNDEINKLNESRSNSLSRC